MGYKNQKRRIITLFSILLLIAINLPAQEKEQADSLVRLLSAKSIQQYEEGSDLIRKAIQPTFLHNGTYLKCDSSFWSENRKIINCIGNVSLSQGDTELTSEKLDYYIDDDLAQFRGTVVELKDKKGNILRTKILDYNTKDSIAIFRSGASMISEDGQIIESVDGKYLNAISIFNFEKNVNMFADSVFIKTDSLLYDSEAKKAHFVSYIDFFKDENMLSSQRGWFDSNENVFFLQGGVHGQGKTNEMWSDSLYYYRDSNNILLLSNAQVQDSTRRSASLSDYLFYEDSLSRVTLKERAAIALWEEKDGKNDTTYLGSNLIVYQGIRKCDISEEDLALSNTRKKTIMSDPIAEFRRRSSEEAAQKAASEQKKNDEAKGKRTPEARKDTIANEGIATPSARNDGEKARNDGAKTNDNEKAVSDTSSLRGDRKADEAISANSEAQSDTTAVTDSIAVAPDTTKIGLITAVGNVKAYRSDMQMISDSMVFNQLDSIARFYKDPLVWNEGRRQYSSDSLFILADSKGIQRANLMGNAFISIQEDSAYFDQIRSTEVMAYFDTTTALRRFDALGGVNALFCIQENEVIATINKVESRTLTADLLDGELQKVYYFESPKNDASPAAQMQEADKRLKGFKWNPELKPNSKDDITTLSLKPSERSTYNRHPQAKFDQTDRFFPGYMTELYASLENIRRERQKRQAEKQKADSLATQDSLSTQNLDSLKTDSLAVKDSISTVKDSLSVPKDSVSTAATDTTKYMSPAELRRALRIARRDARWAEQDKRDAERLAAKEAKAKERAAKKEARRRRQLEKQASKDKKLYDYYVDYYTKQKYGRERKKSKSSGERTPGVETGGGIQSSTGPQIEALGSDTLLRDNGTDNDSLVLSGSGLPRT